MHSLQKKHIVKTASVAILSLMISASMSETSCAKAICAMESDNTIVTPRSIVTLINNAPIIIDPAENAIMTLRSIEEPVDEVVEPEPEEIVPEEIMIIPMGSRVTEVTDTAPIDPEAWRRTVETIAPDLSDTSDAILEIYETTGIKPSFQLAKFCLESGYGRSMLATKKNNIAGWNAYPTKTQTSMEHATTFSSKSECVNVVGTSMYNNYINRGLTTVSSIANKYCPPNATSWASQVRGLMNRIDNVYSSMSTGI